MPECPVNLFGLSQLMGKLTTVGGMDREGSITGNIYQFDGQSQQWKNSLSPMPTPRYGVTVLTHPKSSKEITAIAVCGGLGDDRRVFNVVEVFSYPASQWYVAEPLPTPLWGITSTTVGTTTYLVGGVDSIIYGTSHCFSVSVDSIIKQATTSKVSQFQHGSEWTPITNPPLISSCAASMDNIVMAIGGWDSSTRSSTAIYFLNERGSWERIWGGGLPRPLGKSTAVCLPSGELMIVGGIGSNGLSSCPLFFGSIDD